MTNQRLIDALRDADAVKFGEFELSHGGTSEYYVDKYVFETSPDCLELIAEAFADRLAELGEDGTKLAGVALGAVPLVAVTSVETGADPLGGSSWGQLRPHRGLPRRDPADGRRLDPLCSSAGSPGAQCNHSGGGQLSAESGAP
mgnify:CR=1 FL=1